MLKGEPDSLTMNDCTYQSFEYIKAGSLDDVIETSAVESEVCYT